jgi:hypothetical protein
MPFWGYGQEISVDIKSQPLEQVFKEIQARSEYRFVYTREEIEGLERVSLNVHNMPVLQVLGQLFSKLPLNYAIEDKFIIVHKKMLPVLASININGIVRDESGKALKGATVQVMKEDLNLTRWRKKQCCS